MLELKSSNQQAAHAQPVLSYGRGAVPVPSAIRKLLLELLSHLQLPVIIDCWQVEQFAANASSQTSALPPLLVELKHPGVVKELIFKRDPIAILEAYLQGFMEMQGAADQIIAFGQQAASFRPQQATAMRAWFECLALPGITLQTEDRPWKKFRRGSRLRDKEAVHYHYDVGNDFYKLWLDPNLVYSCAFYADQEMSLNQAQEAKLDLICRKLQLKPGEHLLDIGCGWGALLRHAVKNYGVTGHGITLSEEQLAYNKAKIQEEGLFGKITVELRHYADLPAEPVFDKVSSIEMIEQVGLANYPTYFSSIVRCLKPGGMFLCQCITTIKNKPQHDLAEKFIADYIFPDGELATLPATLSEAKEAGFETIDIESWRPHYARTLRTWTSNLESVMTKAESVAGSRRAKLWRLYLMGCAASYEASRLGVYQVLLRPQNSTPWNLPMVRDGWLT